MPVPDANGRPTARRATPVRHDPVPDDTGARCAAAPRSRRASADPRRRAAARPATARRCASARPRAPARSSSARAPSSTTRLGFQVNVDLRERRGRGHLERTGQPSASTATPTCPRTNPGSNGQLAIVLDGVIQSAPSVNQPNFDGAVSITGDFSQSEAEDLANILNRGAFPVEMVAQEAADDLAGCRSGVAAGVGDRRPDRPRARAHLPARLLPLDRARDPRRAHDLGAHRVQRRGVRVQRDQLLAQPRRRHRHHRGDRRHRRQLRRVLRADEGRDPQRAHAEERRAAELQDDLADDLVGRPRVGHRRRDPVLAQRRLGAWLRAVPRHHDAVRPVRVLLLHPAGGPAARHGASSWPGARRSAWRWRQ